MRQKLKFAPVEFEKSVKVDISDGIEKELMFVIEKDPHTDGLNIFPMNGTDHITIHREEAQTLIRLLMDHFQFAYRLVEKRKMRKGELTDMTIEERIQLFFDIQQTLANDLGLAFPVKHGEDFPVYDLWEGKLLKIKIDKGVNIKKQDGKVTVEEFDRKDVKDNA